MVMMCARFGALVALAGFLSTFVSAQNSTSSPAATWFFPKTDTQFSLNVAKDSSDIYFRFASPAFSWVGVGFGQGMENSLMFVMYLSGDGNNVTLSPRYGSKHVEPSYDPNIKLEALPGTTTTDDDMMIVNAVCRNCRVWDKGFLDISSKAQPMFYAFGPGNILQSSSRSASLRRHARYGFFTMDMTVATGEGGVPPNSTVANGVTMEGEIVHDRDRVSHAHTILGCMALFVIWPLNVIVVGFFKNIRIHIGVSILIVIFLITSFALGIATSYEYNVSKTFSSPHQIFAFISLLPILMMSILPIPAVSKLNAMIPKLHTPLVTATFLLLVITGGLGLGLSNQTKQIILAYSAVALLIFVFNVSISMCIRKRGSAYARANKRKDDERVEMLKMDGQGNLVQQAYAIDHPTEFGADGQRYAQPRGVVGGGAMPGPQYLLNMHPGVPVNRW